MQALHLFSVAAHAAATALLLAVALAALARGTAMGSEEQPPLLVRALKLYGPTAILSLGVAVMTGAFALTDIKATLRARFYEQAGQPLACKLGAVFVLIILTTYLSFGLGLRVVRAVERGDSPRPDALRSLAIRVAAVAAATLALSAVTLQFSFRFAAALAGTF